MGKVEFPQGQSEESPDELLHAAGEGMGSGEELKGDVAIGVAAIPLGTKLMDLPRRSQNQATLRHVVVLSFQEEAIPAGGVEEEMKEGVGVALEVGGLPPGPAGAVGFCCGCEDPGVVDPSLLLVGEELGGISGIFRLNDRYPVVLIHRSVLYKETSLFARKCPRYVSILKFRNTQGHG